MIVLILFAYVILSTQIGKFYFIWPVNLLRGHLNLFNWILFSPLMEVLISIFKCEDGKNKIVQTMNCYEGIHVFFVVLSIIIILLLLLIILLSTFLYRETQLSQTDSSAKIHDYSEILWILFRLLIVIYSTFVFTVF